MGLLDFIAKPMEDVVNAIEGGANKTHTKQNGAVSSGASVLQTQAPTSQTPLPKIKPTNTGVQPNFAPSPSNQSATPTSQTAIQNEQNSQKTANVIANSPGGQFVQGVSTGASSNYNPQAYENQKGANSPAEAGAIVGSALPALGMADNPLQGLDMTLPAINQAKAGTNAAIDETKANVAAQPGGLEAGFIKNPFSRADDTAAKTQASATSPVRITLKPSVYGAGREAAAQKTVDTIVPGSTATEKYNNLEPTMSNLGDKIELAMAKNPKSASLDQIMSDYDKNLQDQGVYRTSQSTKKTIQETAQSYINDLQNEASAGNTVLNPSAISDTSLLKIKQHVNQDAQSIYKKIENGTTLTDKDRVILAARQTVDDTITTLHPEIKDLTTQQSHLYDAADSLYKGREAELKGTQPGQPMSPWQKARAAAEIGGSLAALGYVGGKVATNPLTKALIASGEQAFQNKFGNQPSSTSSTNQSNNGANTPYDKNYIFNQQHITSSSIPRTQADVKADSYGNYPIANPQNIDTPYGYPVAMNKAFHDSQLSKLQTKQNTDKALYGESSLQYANDTSAIDTLNNIYTGSGDIQKAYNSSSKVSSLVAKVKSEVAGLSDSLLQNTTFDQLSSINNGQYRGLKNDIVTLAQSYGIDPSLIWQQQDSKALTGTLDSIGQQNAWNWANYINGLTGNSGASNLASPVAQGAGITANSPMPSMKPQGKVQIFNSGTSSGGNQQLPSIPNFQQIGSQFAQ